MKTTSIDIGTNTVLLLVAEIADDGSITPLAYEQRTPRLGKDVDANKKIGRAAFERVAKVLREFKRISEELGSSHIVAVGTSALRDAANNVEFVEFIEGATGIRIEVLSGEEEAALIYRGAVSGLSARQVGSSTYAGLPDGRVAVVDIGGGSTEITTGHSAQPEQQLSLNLGSVRLTERYLRHDPPLLSELAYATEFTQNALNHLDDLDLREATTVGVAGTVTTLAILDQQLPKFDREKVSGYILTDHAVERLYYRLRAMKVEEILDLSEVTVGRADIITAGALILHELMKKTGTEKLIVSERGVRYGLALREWERLKEKGKEQE